MRRTMPDGIAFAGLEDLEPRALLSSSLNPDGPVVFGTSERVSSVVVADFDRDGTQDMVVAAGNSLRLLRGLGAGRFAAPRTIATFNTSAGLAVAGNFDGDTLPDLYVVQQTDTPGGRGWTRLLLNLGNGNFFTSSYGRVFGMRAESLTAGNLDSDAQDEVALVGDRETVEKVVNPADQEMRILDPRYDIGPDTAVGAPDSRGIQAFAARVRMVQTTELRGSSMTAPTIVRRGDHGDLYIAMAAGSQDADGSVRVYGYQELTPVDPGSPAGGALSLLGSTPISGRPTSMAAGQIDSVQPLDVAVTTIGPDSGAPLEGNRIAAVFGKTYVLRGQPPGGDVPTTSFDAPVLVHSRALGGEDPGLSGVRQYHIVKLSDLNSDGLTDIGLSIVESDGQGGARAQFVQLIQNSALRAFGGNADAQGLVPPIFSFTGVIGWSQTTTGVTPGTAAAFAFTHVLADLRGTGRDDLIVLDRPTASGTTGVRIVQNTVAFKRPRIVGTSITSADTPQRPGPQAPAGSKWDLHATSKTPETVRGIQTTGVRMYRDSNHNGVLDAADQLLGSATQDPTTAVVMDFDGSTSWTFQITARAAWGRGVQQFFAVASDSNSLESSAALVGTLTIV